MRWTGRFLSVNALIVSDLGTQYCCLRWVPAKCSVWYDHHLQNVRDDSCAYRLEYLCSAQHGVRVVAVDGNNGVGFAVCLRHVTCAARSVYTRIKWLSRSCRNL